MPKNLLLFFLLVILRPSNVTCQNSEPRQSKIDTMNWWKKDYAEDSLAGISWNKAIEFTISKNIPTKKPITIAIIDTDFDINHKAIYPLLSINEGEIAGNAIDDDKNGYVDDHNGWNFLGLKNKDSALAYVLMEETRILKEYDSVTFKKLRRKNKLPFSFKDVKSSYDSTIASLKGKIEPYKEIEPNYTFVIDTLKKLIKDDITLQSLVRYTPANDTILNYVQYAKYYFENDYPYDEFMEYLELKEKSLEICMNLNYDNRVLIEDKSDCIENLDYGNNSLGNNISILEHGTTVSGVIVQSVVHSINQEEVLLKKNLPMKLLPITFTGIGDFTDKDFFVAVKYAIDNGAHIINLSQGKPFSKNPKILKKAFDLAERKNVLIVLSSGNQGVNLDNTWRFPQSIPRLFNKEYSNLIIVGATSDKLGTNLIEEDSNYGENSVDIFAPGFEILTCTPNDQYDTRSGTSYATPIVSNVAALLWSLYPKLEPAEIKRIIMDSGTIYDGLVNLPLEKEDSESVSVLPFNKTSKSGKLVNAYNAIKLAGGFKEK